MARFTNILASVALATALMPIAANAMTKTPLDYVRVAAHTAISGPLPAIQNVALKYVDDQTVVRSGGSNQRYPESTGG